MVIGPYKIGIPKKYSWGSLKVQVIMINIYENQIKFNMIY